MTTLHSFLIARLDAYEIQLGVFPESIERRDYLNWIGQAREVREIEYSHAEAACLWSELLVAGEDQDIREVATIVLLREFLVNPESHQHCETLRLALGYWLESNPLFPRSWTALFACCLMELLQSDNVLFVDKVHVKAMLKMLLKQN